MRLFAFALCLTLLTACSAPPIETERMRPSKAAIEQLPVNTALFQNVSLGQSTVPLDAAEEATAGNVTQSAFHDALESALLDAAMLARVGTPGLYRLDARMVEFEKPGWGFTFEVPSSVEYTLTRADGTVAWKQTLPATGEGGFGDAFFSGIERRRIAMSSSVRENVALLIRTLSSQPLGGAIVPRKPAAVSGAVPGTAPAAQLPPSLPQ